MFIEKPLTDLSTQVDTFRSHRGGLFPDYPVHMIYHMYGMNKLSQCYVYIGDYEATPPCYGCRLEAEILEWHPAVEPAGA
jgi:hypothetical protein